MRSFSHPANDGERPKSASDVIRGLVLAADGVTEHEASVLMVILNRLDEIETESGMTAAYAAARQVRKAWLDRSLAPV